MFQRKGAALLRGPDEVAAVNDDFVVLVEAALAERQLALEAAQVGFLEDSFFVTKAVKADDAVSAVLAEAVGIVRWRQGSVQLEEVLVREC